MEDIARRLGISKKTIYQHFSDKQEILQQVISGKITDSETKADCLTVHATNPVEEILMVLDMMRKNSGQVSPNFLIDIQRHYPDAFALYKQHKENYIMRSILENIQKGIDQGLYRSDINPPILARLRAEQIEWAFNNDFFPTNKYDMLEVQRELMHHFVRGILTEKGFAVYNQYLNQFKHEVERVQPNA